MKKKANKPFPDITLKVLSALDSPNWKYRTASGIAKETHLQVAQVQEVLKKNPSVRVSLTKSNDGAPLFASKKKVSAIDDTWTAIKAVSKARYG